MDKKTYLAALFDYLKAQKVTKKILIKSLESMKISIKKHLIVENR